MSIQSDEYNAIRKRIRRGQWTVEDARQLGLTAKQIAELEAIERCGHRNARVVLIMSQCQDCGLTFDHRFASEYAELQQAATQIHQGLIDLQAVRDSGKFTAERIAELAKIERCRHPRESRAPARCCASEAYRERCLACGRVFADRSQWVLKEAENA